MIRDATPERNLEAVKESSTTGKVWGGQPSQTPRAPRRPGLVQYLLSPAAMSHRLAVGWICALAALGAAARADVVPPPLELPATLTLDEALKLFRLRGFDLLIAEAQVQSAEGDVKVAGAIPNPSTSAGFYRAFFESGLFETPWGWFVAVGDSNAIEDTLSGKRGLRQKVARAALSAARMNRIDAQRTLEFQLKQQYFQVVLAGAALDFVREVQATASQTFQLNQVKYRAGAISEADVAKAETAKLEADQALDNARQALRQTQVSLAFLLGVRGGVPDYAVQRDLLRYEVPRPLQSASRNSLLSDAFDHRPDLKASSFHRQRAQSQVSLAKRLRFPDFSLSAEYAVQGSSRGIPAGPPNPTVDAMGNPLNNGIYIPGTATTPIAPPTLLFTLAGTLPLFYQQQGEIRKAEADFKNQQLQRAKLEAQVTADVETAYAAYDTTRKLVERMESRLLDRAKRARDLVQVQYQKGAASLLEYLDAQRTYIATNVEYLQDLTNYWTAVFQLEQAVGMELRQ